MKMRKEKELHRVTELSLAQQNYIEVIHALSEKTGAARTVDLARRLGVKMPSVTEVVSRLAKAGLVERQSRHEIVLTGRGREWAGMFDQYHMALRRFMTDVMALEATEADALACRIEHNVDRNFIEKLIRLVDLLRERYPDVLRELEGETWKE